MFSRKGYLVFHWCLCNNPYIRSTEGISDHLALSFDLNLSVKVNKKKPRSVYKFTKTDSNKVRMDATELTSKAFFDRNPFEHSV